MALTDEALVERIQHGDGFAFDVLYRRHRTFIRHRVGDLGIRGWETGDMLAVAAIAFSRATLDFRPGRRSTFRSFAGLCIKRKLITEIKLAQAAKRSANNDALSLNCPVGDGDEMGNLLPDSAAGPCDRLIARETAVGKLRLVGECSPLERAGLVGVANGLTYEQIAELEGKTPKAIDNAVQRARKKLQTAA